LTPATLILLKFSLLVSLQTMVYPFSYSMVTSLLLLMKSRRSWYPSLDRSIYKPDCYKWQFKSSKLTRFMQSMIWLILSINLISI